MAGEGEFPKSNGDVLYASEVNRFAGFGDGSDGAFNETSGTINLTQGTVYQYTSFNLGASATLSASSTSDKPIIILVQGDCTIDGTIDLKGKGQPASTGYYSHGNGNNTYGFATAGYSNGVTNIRFGGRKGGPLFNFQNNQKIFIMNGTGGSAGHFDTGHYDVGGSGGASSINNGVAGESSSYTTNNPGAGGAGGCTLLMIIGGNLTFGASSSIDTSGEDGGDGASQGGGGGGSGDILIFYGGTKTDNGVTTTANGGSGGADTTNGSADGGDGGDGQVKIQSYDTILW
ncbi:MAG: hypothetical protein ACTSXD_11905 [Candidatus Heimdallarchaeaceae archaeon]